MQLVVAAGLRRFGPPSVRYRGVFLNDEDWGLQPWAAKTYEPERGDIGPKTYARIFELLLRLKANTIWPAMHACTRPFNAFPENKQVADDYAIVMGSSHAEPMLRNNVGEWTGSAEEFEPSTDQSRILSDAPVLQYDLQLFTAGDVKVICYLVPTHPLQAGRGLRFAIGFDNHPPKVVTVREGMEVPSSEWSQNVLNAATLSSTTLNVKAAGSHVLKLYMIDPGVVVDKIVIDTGGLRPSYLGPPETRVVRR